MPYQHGITMGLKDQVKAFTEKAKAELEAKQKEVEFNSMKVLRDLLGEDLSKIKSITLDPSCGKFFDVVAPENIISKLRAANLIKEF